MAGTGRELPRQASVVIIGGGIMGVSTAYQLAAADVTGVVLVDADAFGSGSTSKAAGGVRAQFSDPINIRLALRRRATGTAHRSRWCSDTPRRRAVSARVCSRIVRSPG